MPRAIPASAMALLVAILNGCSDSTSPNGGGDSAPPIDVQGRWYGTWESTVYYESGDFTVDLVQDGTTLSGTIDIPDIGMSDAQLSGRVTGTSIRFGDIDEQIAFVGTVGDDSASASGTYDYATMSDEGTWEATRRVGSFITVVDSVAVPGSLTGDLTFDGEDFRLLGTGGMVYTVDPSSGVIDSTVSPGSYPDGIAFDGQCLLVGDSPWGTGKIFKLDPWQNSVLSSPSSGSITGLAHDGSGLWCANDHYQTPRIYRINADGAAVDSLDCTGSSVRGLAFDGSYLWYTSFDAGQTRVYQIDVSGATVSSFEAPSFIAAGLTWDGAYLWYADWSDNRIYQLDTAGSVISSFDSPGESPADLAFDGARLWHADGDVAPGPDRIYELDTAGNVISSIDCPGYSPGGLTFDGTHLWHADTQTGRIYRLAMSGDNYWAYPPLDVGFLTSDGNCLWSNDETAQTLYRFSSSGSILASFGYPCTRVGGLAWDGASLWVAASGGIDLEKLLRVDPSGQVLASYEPFGQLPAPFGMAFDGTDLWYVGREPFQMTMRLYRLSLG